MDLTQLRYFREIARAGSMTGAARSLRVSQPTVSVAIKQLEGSLNTTLFQRHRGGVSLTASGEELLRHVDEVMAVLDRAVERISGLDHELTGSFVIGCHESLGAYFLPDFLEQLLRDAQLVGPRAVPFLELHRRLQVPEQLSGRLDRAHQVQHAILQAATRIRSPDQPRLPVADAVPMKNAAGPA